MLATRDGAVWMGNSPALDVLRKGKFSAIAAQNGLPGAVVTSLFEDHQGRLWVGVDDGLTVYEKGRFRAINDPGGKSLGVVTAIAEDVDHNIWVAVTRPALIRIQDDRVREETQPPTIPRVQSLAADSKDGIWLGLMNGSLARYHRGQLDVLPTNRRANVSVRNLLVESDGSVWGATQDGVFRWKDGHEKTLTSANGLPCDDVSMLLRDNRGSLWLDTQCGFVIIDPSELDRWWTQPDVRLRVTTLDAFDGAQPGMTNFRPEASKSPDGKLWFANQNVLQVVDPASLQSNVVPPPVHVEQIIVDRKVYAPRDGLRLPALSRDIEIDYTALSLVTPEKVRFRYKLEGHDADWQDPEARRQAFYSDLSLETIGSVSSPAITMGFGTTRERRRISQFCPHFFRPRGFGCSALSPPEPCCGCFTSFAFVNLPGACKPGSRSAWKNGKGSPATCTTHSCRAFLAYRCSSMLRTTAYPRTRPPSRSSKESSV